jgi:hypothetical protein
MANRLSVPLLNWLRAALMGSAVLAMALAGSAGCNWG